MTATTWTVARRKELALRAISAAFLVPFAVFVVWTGGVVLAVACALFAAIMAYEWVRMTNSPSMTVMTSLAGLPTLAVFVFSPAIGLGTLAICAVIAALAHPLARERMKAGFGQFYIAGMPLALFILQSGEHWEGATAALILMILVWTSDTFAFFTGRTLGGPSLSRASPSKTWSGAIGGALFSALFGLLAAYVTGGHALAWIAAGGLVSVVAQLGDLFESVLKRRLGVKDASGLLPGHGGVMDRVDGLGVAAVFGVAVLGGAPGVAALLGLIK